MQGTLVIWSEPKAFGFVQPDGTSEKLFIHITNFGGLEKDKVRLGARIEFEIGDPISLGKKPQAVRAKLLPVSIEISAGASALAGVSS